MYNVLVRYSKIWSHCVNLNVELPAESEQLVVYVPLRLQGSRDGVYANTIAHVTVWQSSAAWGPFEARGFVKRQSRMMLIVLLHETQSTGGC
jgi:hypothetical protein